MFSVPAKFGGYSLIADAAIIFFLIFAILPFEPCLNMLEKKLTECDQELVS